jgi:hypothetical protein
MARRCSRVSIEIRDTARRYGPACITTLAQMAGLTGGKPIANPAVRVAAMRELLDRGYGKATQPVAGDRNAPLLVDFRWSDGAPAIDGTAIQPRLIEAEPIADDDASELTETGAAD